MLNVTDAQAIFLPTLTAQIRLLPFFMLQLVGVVGVFTFTLMAFRGKAKYASQQVLYGLVFGITGYLMTGLVQEFLGGTFKPYVRHELLFLAALLGGWPAGLIAGVFNFMARIQFGGSMFWMLSAVETLVFIGAGALLHPWATRRDLLTVKCRDVLCIALVKTGVSLVSIYAIHLLWPESITQPLLMTFWTNRMLVFPVFFGIVYGLLLILKMDAKQQHYQRKELQEMSEKMQSAAMREQLLLAISHSLKTPLTRLRLRLEMLDDTLIKQDFESDISVLDGMVTTALNTLRNANGEEETTPTRLDLLIRHLASQPIYLDARIDTQLAPITLALQPQSMERALGNLLDNGILYGQRLTVQLRQENNLALLTIRDAGPGIAIKDMYKVFQPHVRLDYAQQVNANGTGLGLSISKKVIRAHGGEIRLRNHPEGGLEVRVQLPLNRTPSTAALF